MGDGPNAIEGLVEPKSLSATLIIKPLAIGNATANTSIIAQDPALANSMLKSATHRTKRAASEHRIYSDFGSNNKERANLLDKKAGTKSKSKKTTPRKKKKLMPVLAAAEIRECSCKISDSWKGDVALWGTLNFES
jgi:hypothetical protein